MIIETLMVPLRMIVTQVRSDRIAERHFTHKDHPTQRFLFDGTPEALAMGMQIWRPRWQNHGVYPAAAKLM
jgi:hypothetical protein